MSGVLGHVQLDLGRESQALAHPVRDLYLLPESEPGLPIKLPDGQDFLVHRDPVGFDSSVLESSPAVASALLVDLEPGIL